MGLLDKYKKEKEKYICCMDFINLIAFTTDDVVDDVISYLVINDFEQYAETFMIDYHGRIMQSEHNQNYGFDYNIRKFLTESYGNYFFTTYMTYENSRNVPHDFYLNKDQLNTIDFINELNLQFEDVTQVHQAVKEYKKENENFIYRHFKSDFEDPNIYQTELFKFESFTITDVACLLAGVSPNDVERHQNHPKFTEVYSDYISYKLMIQNDKDYLALTDFTSNIPAENLQKYLYRKGYILKGFNDWLNIEPAKPIIANSSNTNSQKTIETLNNRITELEEQLKQFESENIDKKPLSNVELINLKQQVIAKSNYHLSKAIKHLDYRNHLSRTDVFNFIEPFMNEMISFLSEGDRLKEEKLTINRDTVLDEHMNNLGFKVGNQSNKIKQKRVIDLNFDKDNLPKFDE